jgi:hypothetical protein
LCPDKGGFTVTVEGRDSTAEPLGKQVGGLIGILNGGTRHELISESKDGVKTFFEKIPVLWVH